MKRKLTIAVDSDIEGGEIGVSLKIEPPPDPAMFKELRDGIVALAEQAAAEIKAKAGK